MKDETNFNVFVRKIKALAGVRQGPIPQIYTQLKTIFLVYLLLCSSSTQCPKQKLVQH
jgi:hypothetical protein